MSTTSRVLPWRRNQSAVNQELLPLLSAFKQHHPKASIAQINVAYAMASSAHKHQSRMSGELYVSHPLAVARIVAEIGLDEVSLVAALLHDAVEDTEITLADVESNFGAEIAGIVDGLTKLERLQFDSREAQQAATMRKMLVAMARDLRVLIIKLSDRLHNMRTLYAVNKQEKAIVIANETLQVWCSLAEKLGMWAIKSELEDLCFAVMDPKSFDAIKAARETTWKTSSKEKNSGVDQSSTDVNELFGVDTLPLLDSLKSKAKESVASSSADDEASQYAEWQLDMKKRIETVPSFDWLSTRDGESFYLDGIDELPSSVSSSLSTLDKIRSRLWQDLLIDGFGTDVKISISSRLKSAYSTHLKMKRKSVDIYYNA